MNAPIGIGFLSFAHGHVAAYARVMRGFEDVRLVAGYDDKPERGQPICEETGMRYTPHAEDILGDPGVQAVIIGSETSRHAEWCIAAAEAGKDILCQKPMALNLADCNRMIKAAEHAGVRLALGFQMRHDPANIRMRELVQSGELGRIIAVRRRHCIGVLLDPNFVNGPSHWHLEADKNLGMFADDAAHPADWMHWTFGKPVSVMAEIGRVLSNAAPDDTGIAIYRFEDGSMGTIFNSSVVSVGENTTEIYGEKGVLIQNYGDAPSCNVAPCPEGPALKIFRYGNTCWEPLDVPRPASHGERICAVPRPWVDSLLNGTPLPATGRDGRVALEMVLGAYQSAHEGRRITFPLAPSL